MNQKLNEIAIKGRNNKDVENPYLVLGFVDFAIMSTLMIAFFPWSLVFCWMVYGWDETRFIILALLHDGLKTLLAFISILFSLIIIIIALVYIFS